MNLVWKFTKRDKIIQIANQDPFKTMIEIAEEVETTQSYVGTILGEVGISLRVERKRAYMELKKKEETPK